MTSMQPAIWRDWLNHNGLFLDMNIGVWKLGVLVLPANAPNCCPFKRCGCWWCFHQGCVLWRCILSCWFRCRCSLQRCFGCEILFSIRHGIACGIPQSQGRAKCPRVKFHSASDMGSHVASPSLNGEPSFPETNWKGTVDSPLFTQSLNELLVRKTSFSPLTNN